MESSVDTGQIVQLIGALAFVLALMGGLSLLIKKLGLAGGTNPFDKKRRLAISETLSLDNKRKAMILRCDDEEHLVILGVNSENFIKTLDKKAKIENDAPSSKSTPAPRPKRRRKTPPALSNDTV